MNQIEKTEEKNTYICYAPPPTDPSIAPSIYYIEVTVGIQVEWQWTHLPDGNRVVTDYKLTPPENDEKALCDGV
jgi:hypothetical protein